MRTSRRPSRLAGFGLVDSLMGLFLVLATVGALASGYSTLSSLTARQQEVARDLMAAVDGEAHAKWY